MRVERLWPGETVVCIGGGASLTPEDISACAGLRLIAINDAYLLAPYADVLYGADAAWWNAHGGVPSFKGLKYSIMNDEKSPTHPDGVQLLKNTGLDGIETDPSGLRTGKHSGYQAINLAVHLGAVRVLLLGYDAQATDDRLHWHGSHPPGLNNPTEEKFIAWRNAFESIVAPLEALGVTVVNCSRQTALTCFPRQSLAEALATEKRVAA